mgnify:CR=1 FL=1
MKLLVNDISQRETMPFSYFMTDTIFRTKGKDHVRQGESEEMFEYLICAICPVSGDYEPGEPECGFLFPAFFDGGAALNCVDVFQADSEHPHQELLQILFSEKS